MKQFNHSGRLGRSELLIPNRWVDNLCSSLTFRKPPCAWVVSKQFPVLLCCLIMVPPLEYFEEWFLCFLEAFLNYTGKYFYDWFLKLKQFTRGLILASFFAISWVYYWVHFLFFFHSSYLCISEYFLLLLFNSLFCLFLLPSSTFFSLFSRYLYCHIFFP